MVLVFILLAIFILVIAISFIVLLSTVHIEIKNLEVTNIKIQTQNLAKYEVIFSLYLLNKFKWISIHLNDKKMRKMYSKMKLEKIDIQKLEKEFKWEDLKTIKKLQLKISYLNLKTEIGVESPVITAFLVSTISSIIAIFLPYVAIDFKKQNYQYVIIPIYQRENLYKIQFNCIIQVKVVHIINVMYMLFKKGRSDLNERTASNRRAYGYSHE